MNDSEAIEDENEEVENENDNEPDQVNEEPMEEDEENPLSMIETLQRSSEISLVPKSALMPARSSSNDSTNKPETEIINSNSSFNWTKVTENPRSKSIENSQDGSDKESTETPSTLLQNFLLEHQRSQAESNLSNSQVLETEYVSLERLAEKVNVCRICNEKFADSGDLESHKARAGHYQCTTLDCTSLIFKTASELSTHVAQMHGTRNSPNLPSVSPRSLPHNSPHSNSPHLSQTSPHLNTHSPHSPNFQAQGSPMTSPHATASPTYSNQSPTAFPPVNLEQLPAPVQQLAQQVQRMPLPQPQMQPGSNSMMQGAAYYPGHPGRPPLYRVQAPIHYPPHMTQMYQQYPGNPYPQMNMQQQMPHQQMARARYPAVHPGQR